MPAQLTFTAAEVESLRRSAAMAPLAPQDLLAVLDDLKAMHRERAEVQRLLAELRAPWGEIRRALSGLDEVISSSTTTT